MSDIDERLEEEILHAFRKSFDSQEAGINLNFLTDIQREIERLRADLAAVTEERDRMRALLVCLYDAAGPLDADKMPADDFAQIILDVTDAPRAALEGVTEPQQSGAGASSE